MSVDSIKIEATPRTETGSASARRMRHQGQVPAILYSEGKEGVNVQLNKHEFTQMLRHHANESLVVDLAIESQGSKKALLKEVQHHPLTGDVLHVDFLEISMTQRIKVEFAVDLIGVPVGVSQDGGILDTLVHSIEVECLPGDLLDKVEIDVSALEIGEHLTVGQLGLDESKYTVLTAAGIAVANVLEPRVSADDAAADEEAAAAAAAEPEVLTEKQEEGGEA